MLAPTRISQSTHVSFPLELRPRITFAGRWCLSIFQRRVAAGTRLLCKDHSCSEMALLGNPVRVLYAFPSCSLSFVNVKKRKFTAACCCEASRCCAGAVFCGAAAAVAPVYCSGSLYWLTHQQQLGCPTMHPSVFSIEKVPAF